MMYMMCTCTSTCMYVTGNEGSAFVEVLVGRSSAPDDYKVYIHVHVCTCF